MGSAAILCEILPSLRSLAATAVLSWRGEAVRRSAASMGPFVKETGMVPAGAEVRCPI